VSSTAACYAFRCDCKINICRVISVQSLSSPCNWFVMHFSSTLFHSTTSPADHRSQRGTSVRDLLFLISIHTTCPVFSQKKESATKPRRTATIFTFAPIFQSEPCRSWSIDSPMPVTTISNLLCTPHKPPNCYSSQFKPDLVQDDIQTTLQ
jgi:hypothetical protein